MLNYNFTMFKILIFLNGYMQKCSVQFHLITVVFHHPWDQIVYNNEKVIHHTCLLTLCIRLVDLMHMQDLVIQLQHISSLHSLNSTIVQRMVWPAQVINIAIAFKLYSLQIMYASLKIEMIIETLTMRIFIRSYNCRC